VFTQVTSIFPEDSVPLPPNESLYCFQLAMSRKQLLILKPHIL